MSDTAKPAEKVASTDKPAAASAPSAPKAEKKAEKADKADKAEKTEKKATKAKAKKAAVTHRCFSRCNSINISFRVSNCLLRVFPGQEGRTDKEGRQEVLHRLHRARGG